MINFLSIYIYFFVPVVLMLGFLGSFKQTKRYVNFFSILLVLLSLILLLMRSPYAPSDAYSYASMFESTISITSVFEAYHGDYFFSFIQYLINLTTIDSDSYLLVQSAIIFLMTVVGFRLIIDDDKQLLLGLSLFVMTSTFILLSTNVMRQGLALALILVSVGLFSRGFRKTGYLVLLLSIFTHFSAVIVALIILTLRINKIKRLKLPNFIFFIPLLPVFSPYLLRELGSLGGVFEKINSFSNIEYDNKVVYIKVFLLYMAVLLFALLGRRYKGFENASYLLIFEIYTLLVAVSFFTLPILILSSRYIYYASGLMPILFAFVLYQKNNLLDLHVRFGLFSIIVLFYASFVFSFNSIRLQLGI